MNRLTNIIHALWYNRESFHPLHPLPFVALCVSHLFSGVVSVRNKLYDKGISEQRRLSCPVISVGNIAVGGTGKTPTVILIAGQLRDLGMRPAVLSRGYGGSADAPVNIVSDGNRILMNPVEAGDEPVLMAKSLPGIPVLTGISRFDTGSYAVHDLSANVLLLDDGFQHRSLHRDVNIVLVDTNRPFGNGYMLPRGPLREKAEALRRADAVIRMGIPSQADSALEAIPFEGPIFNGCHHPKDIIGAGSGVIHAADTLRNKRICAFTGIGVPDSFRSTLQNLDARIQAFMSFPDHYRYTEQDLDDIRKTALRSSAELIVTTEKDAIKLSDYRHFCDNLLVLRTEIRIAEGTEALMEWIRSRI
jgi:tetraacyldisaccharide 4'-kinase